MIQKPQPHMPPSDAAGVPTLRRNRAGNRPRQPQKPVAKPQPEPPAAGIRSAFIPSNSFAGNRPGYAFKRVGEQGPGYYRMHETGAHLPRNGIPDDFLARLEMAEQHDDDYMRPFANGASNGQASAAYRQHGQQGPPRVQQQSQRPDWATIGATEASRAYHYHGQPAFAERSGMSRNMRSQFDPMPSQVPFTHPKDHEPQTFAYRRSGAKDDQPAGGAPNLSGSSDAHGVRHSLLASAGVNFLS